MTGEKPTVLIIAYYYPPCRESGAIRPFGLAKYLGDAGWNALVLTPRLDRAGSEGLRETEYVDVISQWKRRLGLHPERALRQQLKIASASGAADIGKQRGGDLIKQLRWLLTYPDPLKGWYPYAVNEIKKLRETTRIDAIVSTSPPIVAQIIGASAKRMLGCPWIADFRDLWNTDDETFEDRGGIVGAVQARTEKKMLAGADMLVTVSDPWANQLRARYPNKRVETITNAFDPDEIATGQCDLTPKFTITHTGMLYEGRRDPSLLLQVLRDLIDAGEIKEKDLLLRFYGPVEPFLIPLLKRHGMERVSEVSGPVPRPEVLKLQRESQLLLLLSWSGPNENGVHTGKVFEYLAARRPILGIGGIRGVMTELLEETDAGVHVLSTERLRQYLLNAYREFRQSGGVKYRGNSEVISKYSHPGMARSFAALLNEVTARNKSLGPSLAPLQEAC